MKKKILIYSLILIICVIGLYFFFSSGIKYLFSSQYNENGVSHFLVITIDKNQQREYISSLDGYRIFVENLNIEETNFRNINAENVSIKDAIDNKLVSIKEWEKYAWSKKKEGDAIILQFENYEIECAYDDCIIRPLSR